VIAIISLALNAFFPYRRAKISQKSSMDLGDMETMPYTAQSKFSNGPNQSIELSAEQAHPAELPTK